MAPRDSKAFSESVTAFEKLGVCKELAEAAASLGWKSPTAIQEQAIPQLLAGGALLQHPTWFVA